VRVAEVMQEDYAFVAPDDTLLSARQLMASRGLSALPVLEDGELLGVISAAQLDNLYSLLAAEKRVP